VRSLPFLAQYLAQEIVAPDEVPSRFSARNDAYRATLSNDAAAAPQLDIQA
jgi:hypothetical protein